MVDRAAQLSRIAAARPIPVVRIYRLDNGGLDWPYWLCGRHLAKRKLDGWSVKEDRDAPHELACDDRALFACGEEVEP